MRPSALAFYQYRFSPNNIFKFSTTAHTFTLGLDRAITDRITNETRANYSNLKSEGGDYLSTLGGAVPLSNQTLSQIYPPGVDPAKASLAFFVQDFSSYLIGPYLPSEQRQVNLVDNLSLIKGSHSLKFGGDVRWLNPFQGSLSYALGVFFVGLNGQFGVLSGQTLGTSVVTHSGVSVRAKNFSLYGQDTWRVIPRLTLTFGLRWDVNPAPRGKDLASDPVVVAGLNDPATMTLAPRGTPFYSTTFMNFAPRIGLAYQLRTREGWSAVIRGGVGTFYDIGAGQLGSYTFGYPFGAGKNYDGATFPLTPQQAAPPIVDLSAPAGGIYVAEPNLALPRTYQWNVAVEQSLGQKQTVSVTYLGTLGRKLLRSYGLNAPNPNFASFISVTTNQGTSDYQALQVQFQRQVMHGLQALASYTYSHSIDNASDSSGPYSPMALGPPSIDRGSSDFDVRHSASGALTYDLPEPAKYRLARAILGGWSVQDLLIVRTALPVDLTPDFYSVGPFQYSARPNVVPGVPFYLYGDQYPGRKAINPAAFSNTTPGTQGNLRRNTLRGFGAWQNNFAVHRRFALTEKLNLQFRAEAFNLFNHPNFDNPGSFQSLQSPAFGISQSTLANALAELNGFNALYQIGGPRSWQLGLRLQF